MQVLLSFQRRRWRVPACHTKALLNLLTKICLVLQLSHIDKASKSLYNSPSIDTTPLLSPNNLLLHPLHHLLPLLHHLLPLRLQLTQLHLRPRLQRLLPPPITKNQFPPGQPSVHTQNTSTNHPILFPSRTTKPLQPPQAPAPTQRRSYVLPIAQIPPPLRQLRAEIHHVAAE